MPYTPVELRHVRIGRALFGYKREATERLLDDVAESFEGVWRERGELADQVESLDKQLAEIREREHLLAATLVAAEKSAEESRAAAKRDAELIVAEAHLEARSITRGAQSERDRLFAEARRIEALLRGALGIVEESAYAAPDAAVVAAPGGPAADSEVPSEPAEERVLETDDHLDGLDEQIGDVEEPSPFGAAPEPDRERLPWPNKEDTAEFPSLVPSTGPEAESDAG
jgi:cell division initiation protein